MTKTMMEPTTCRIDAGDVVEFELEGVITSALVLLVTEEFAILDPCDERTPVVVRNEELDPQRVFHGSEVS